MPNENSARRVLPVELEAIVISLSALTRQMTKKLTREETIEVISHLCERLRAVPGERPSSDQTLIR